MSPVTEDDDPTGAHAAVLARLWGAYAREPLDGVITRRVDGDRLTLTLSGDRTASGPAEAAQPFFRAERGLTIDADGCPTGDAGALLTAISPPSAARDRLRAELDNSTVNLALARACAPRERAGTTLPDLEQSIVDGHPLHPLCRSRIGLSPTEIRRYAPEFRPIVELAVVAVPPDRWLTTGTGMPPRLPMHPWQREHVLDAYPELRPTGDVIRARPLMSLRTVAPIDTPGWHLKTAVDVAMTSAVRTVSPAAVRNGPIVSDLLGTLAYGRGLDIFAEVAAGAVLVDGAPQRSLAVVQRRVPPTYGGEVMMPFAVLSARSPESGRAYLTELTADPVTFFRDAMTVALPPLLALLAHGVALEAHGQNLLLVIDEQRRPARIAYRDMGGVRISPRRLAAAGIDVPALAGDLATDDPDELRTKFGAAFLSTVVAELIATISQEYALDPAALWGVVAHIVRTCAGLPDAAAMLGATLPMKAMVSMRLADHPLEDIWTAVANPMAGL